MSKQRLTQEGSQEETVQFMLMVAANVSVCAQGNVEPLELAGSKVRVTIAGVCRWQQHSQSVSVTCS